MKPRLRPLLLLPAAGVLVVAVVAFLLLRGDDAPPPARVADPLGVALSYVPASAPLVATVETDAASEQGRAVAKLLRELPAARFAGDQVNALLHQLGLPPVRELRPLLGAPLVIAGPGLPPADLRRALRAGMRAVLVGPTEDAAAGIVRAAVQDGRLEPVSGGGAAGSQLYRATTADRAGVLALDGPAVVIVADAAAARAALDVRTRGAGLDRAALRSRLGALDGPALLKVAALPPVLTGGRGRGIPFFDALRMGALSVRLERPGAVARFALRTDPAQIKDDDLPLAAGDAPPRPAPGLAPMVLAIRDLSRTLDWVSTTGGKLDVPLLRPLQDGLATLNRVRGPLKTFGRIDVERALLAQLTQTTTITREAGGGFALRAELRDGGPLRTALSRLSAVPAFALNLAGAGELKLSRAGNDTYTFVDGTRLIRIAVPGNLLVVTDDQKTDLAGVARRRPAPARDGPGALSARITAEAVQDLVIERLGLPGLAKLVLGGIGEVRVSARSGPSGIDGRASLTIAP